MPLKCDRELRHHSDRMPPRLSWFSSNSESEKPPPGAIEPAVVHTAHRPVASRPRRTADRGMLARHAQRTLSFRPCRPCPARRSIRPCLRRRCRGRPLASPSPSGPPHPSQRRPSGPRSPAPCPPARLRQEAEREAASAFPPPRRAHRRAPRPQSSPTTRPLGRNASRSPPNASSVSPTRAVPAIVGAPVGAGSRAAGLDLVAVGIPQLVVRRACVVAHRDPLGADGYGQSAQAERHGPAADGDPAGVLLDARALDREREATPSSLPGPARVPGSW